MYVKELFCEVYGVKGLWSLGVQYGWEFQSNEQGSPFTASIFSSKCVALFSSYMFNGMSLEEVDSDEDI